MKMLHKLLAVALVFALAGSSVAGYRKLTFEEKAARKEARAKMTPEQRNAKRDSCNKNGKCKGGRGRKTKNRS